MTHKVKGNNPKDEELREKIKQEITNCLVELIPVEEISNMMGMLDPNGKTVNAVDDIYQLIQDSNKELLERIERELPEKQPLQVTPDLEDAYPFEKEQSLDKQKGYNGALSAVKDLIERVGKEL